MVCHDLTMAARWCSHLILLAHGSLMKSGAPKEVVTSENLAAAFGLRAAAAAFDIPYQKEKEMVQIENGDLILAFGLSAEEKERLPAFPSKARCMSDEKIPGADVKSWQDTCLLIEKEALP